jgi:nucleotide-binding universal stress UspA family protein
MLGVHTILHPTDFSEQSQHAFAVACALARDYGARLMILHAVATPSVYYVEGAVPVDEYDLRSSAQAQLDRLQVPAANVRAERRLEEGDAAETILHVADEIQANLIVMGTHGRTGLGRILMGSVAEEVMRRAACPVLTVRTPFAEPVSAQVSVEEFAGVMAG